MRRRNLTFGEEQLARYVFQNSINYRNVEVVAAIAFVRWAPFGSIRWPFSGSDMPDLIGGDFRKPKDKRVARLFLHEFVHVWQHYVGIRVSLRALGSYAAAIARTGKARAAYTYHIGGADEDVDLLDFTLDQQAEIVADYYAHTLWQVPLRLELIPDDYQAVLKNFFDDRKYPLSTGVMRRLRSRLRWVER